MNIKKENYVSVNSIKLCDEKGIMILIEEYYGLVFANETLANKFIIRRKTYWDDIIGMKLTISPNQNETLKNIELKAVFKNTAKFLNLKYDDVISKKRDKEFVLARKYAIQICRERKVTLQQLAEYLKTTHTTVMHHQKVLRDLRETDYFIDQEYMNLEEFVLASIRGKRIEDGSGVKLKEL